MKNHILKTFMAVIAALLSFSCNDEFLDRSPLDKISSESFWNTENDLIVYNNSLYNLARNDNDVPIMMAFDDGFDSHRYGIWHLSGFSDDTAPRHSRHNNYQRVRAGAHTIPGNPFWYGYKGWNFVRAINVGMDNYDKAQVSDEVRNKYIGEARLMRGWFYADKISKFGSAQWVESEVGVDDEDILNGSRDDRDFVMNKVLEDLNFATTHIPDDWGDGNAPGRLNRWAALLVKSRVALFEGTWRKYHGLNDADTWLQVAADAALELMNDGPYSIFNNGDPASCYNAMHRTEDIAGNPEVIYWRRYERGIFTNHAQSYHRGYNGGATKSMVEDYLCTDGLPITTSPLYMGDEVYENIFENRDPRLRQTVLHPDDQPIYNYGNHAFEANAYPRIQGMTGGQRVYTGYHIIKVFNSASAYASYNSSQTPAISMRLAEALLNYAEAKADLGTLTQGDLDISINLLRDRVGMPHLDINVDMDPKYAGDGISAVLVEIRRERRVELFMEGFRYDDLRRWKQGKKLEGKDYGMRWDAANRARVDPEGRVTVLSGMVDGVEYLEIYKGTDFENPVFDESKHYLWPLPLSAISQNPNLEQNPGW
ncbi:RagB/SusD family nutrient uptake outer membrane protein [Fulvivirgaceae bacterium BMA12]|uniref:RagB/SusD family nutrient uptake outer membrane protein n=1 Tax=Agaribacillus aureus TaxID=3051825 RepID=A0ABT8KZ42_9BACT|nr:RagB/SusD family nutrient uptake outer membrane protein [Fulvivirgaceae bacterium BMA12]